MKINVTVQAPRPWSFIAEVADDATAFKLAEELSHKWPVTSVRLPELDPDLKAIQEFVEHHWPKPKPHKLDNEADWPAGPLLEDM